MLKGGGHLNIRVDLNLGIFFTGTKLLFLTFSILISHIDQGQAEIFRSQACTPVAQIPHAKLQNCMGQNILTLEGDATERAKAHGEIFRKYLSPDVSNYFSRKVDESVDFLPSVFKSVAQYLLSTLSVKLNRNMPQHYATDLKIFSTEAKMSYEQLNKALAAPDLGSLAYSYANSSFKIPWFGCTSIGQIKQQSLVYGRNLDFDGIDMLDKHSLVVVHKPTEKDELQTAAFVADGIHFSGISAFNERGLAVFVHQNYSSEKSLQGLPIMLLVDWMLKSSHDIDEAVNFLQKHKPGPMWTMVLVDTKQKKIKAVESSYYTFGVREPQQMVHGNETRSDFVQTNHLLTSEAQKTQLISYPFLRNSQVRFERAMEGLAKMEGGSSLHNIRELLGYQKTINNLEPSLYDDIAKASTVHTVLLEAKPGQEPEIWLSRSLAPSSQGSFIKFKMADFFSSRQMLKFEYMTEEPQINLAYEKQRVLVQAFKTSEDEHDLPKAIKLTEGFSSPSVMLYRASLFYRLQQWQEVQAVLYDSFQNENDIPKSLHESAAALMVLSLHQQGKYQEARNLSLQYLKEPQWLQNHWFKIISKVAANKKLSSSDLKIWFDSFSGNIETPAVNLTLLNGPLD